MPALAEDQPYVATRALNATSAMKVASASEAACRKMGYQVSVAVTDRNGRLLAFIRDPKSGAHTITMAKDKAYTAATFQSPTLGLDKRIKFMQGRPRVVLIGGGLPISVGGHFYGAVGVSGAPAKKISGDIDDSCARAGIKAIQEVLEFAG